MADERPAELGTRPDGVGDELVLERDELASDREERVEVAQEEGLAEPDHERRRRDDEAGQVEEPAAAGPLRPDP